jgi:hypothetical protein
MSSFDNFGVSNLFYAPQIGLSAEVRYGRCSLDATGKLGLGLLSQNAKVRGGTTLRFADGSTAVSDGGVFAPVGGATLSDDRFAAIPELDLSAACQLTPHIRIRAGYDFLYVSQLTRVASTVGEPDSRQVFQLNSYNPSVAPSGQVSRLPSDSFWVQGLTCGLEFQF